MNNILKCVEVERKESWWDFTTMAVATISCG